MFWNSGAMESTPHPADRASLDRQGWQAILDALDGDTSQRDAAYDALTTAAPQAWLDEQQP